MRRLGLDPRGLSDAGSRTVSPATCSTNGHDRSFALHSNGTVWYYDHRERDEDDDGAGRVVGLPPVEFIGGDAFTVTDLFAMGWP